MELFQYADFVRLENADDFATIHDHDRQRKLNEYFACVILQVPSLSLFLISTHTSHANINKVKNN